MYQVERTSNQVLTLRHEDIAAGWEQRYLLISDVHFDSPHCDRRLLSKHLDKARSDSAGVIVVGDWFDAMGGKNDRRGSKSGVRVDHSRDNYFDCLVDESVTYLTQYIPHLVMLSDGNHETAILKHQETDLLERLARQLNTVHMGYSGFIRFMFDTSNKKSTVRLYYHHGSGGGGPVTKGVIQTNRRAASVDADIYVSGHIHEAWVVENVVLKLNDKGNLVWVTQLHIQLPTYKQEAMTGGYHDEKGRPGKPLGGYELVFYYDLSRIGRIGYRVERTN